MFDVIYLQIENDGSNEFDDQATWCQDKINDTDVKYLLADSKNEAADDLYEALKLLFGKWRPWIIEVSADMEDEYGEAKAQFDNDCYKIERALAKAEGKS